MTREDILQLLRTLRAILSAQVAANDLIDACFAEVDIDQPGLGGVHAAVTQFSSSADKLKMLWSTTPAIEEIKQESSPSNPFRPQKK